MSKSKIIIVAGPTASGKTGMGYFLCKNLNGEIISADSRQVYRGLNLGTGKEELDIPQHLIDICEPEEDFNLFNWLEKAYIAIEDVINRGKVPIIVGGTGLYIQALVEGFELQKTPNNKNKNLLDRGELNSLDIGELVKILKKIDQESFVEIDLNNPRRVIRAIELAQEGIKRTKSEPKYNSLQLAITQPRDVLYKRIDSRVDERFSQGMLKEVEDLIKSGVNPEWLIKLGLEYRIIGLYAMTKNNKFKDIQVEELAKNSKLKIEDFSNFEKMSQLLKYKIHAFARRQLTWFHRFPQIIWVKNNDQAYKIAKKFIG